MTGENPRPLERLREQKPPHREPWIERDMTLCIAGECRHNGTPAIVVVADTQGTDSLAKSYDTYKVAKIVGTNTAIAYCDLKSAAREVMIALDPTVREHLASPGVGDDLAISNFIQAAKAITEAKKRAVVVDHISRTYAQTPTEFYVWAGKEERDEIRALSLRCELLMCHASEALSAIMYMDANGHISWQDHYFGIGTGSVLARAFLSQEDWEPTRSVLDCARRLVAAKIFAERDAFVGAKTEIFVAFPDKFKRFSEKGRKRVYDKRPMIGFHPSEDADEDDFQDTTVR